MLGRNAAALTPTANEVDLIKEGLTDAVQKNKRRSTSTSTAP